MFDKFNNIIDVDKTLKALHTQYQFRSDAIVPRSSLDAPTIQELGLIRDAHLNIITILKELKQVKQDYEDLQYAVAKACPT